jgi:acyl-[acyl-carrier-protein]-phospholipid O-acyltransferase/long-chain-fatty-acid--[acyl-carrier-protein] ligase
MAENNRSETFKWLNATQFFGALNDNLYKLAMVFCLIAANPEINPDSVMADTGAVFVIPFLLFSDAAGVLADRMSKQVIIARLKIIELILMSSAFLCFYFQSSYGLYIVLFLMCTQSAFFGPAKYGIIPELVSTGRLSKSNSHIVSATFLAIIIGTLMASVLAGGKNGLLICGTACILISMGGIFTSRRIYKTPPGGGKEKINPLFFIGIWKTIKSVAEDRYLLMSILTSSYFWLVAAYAQMNLIPYGIDLMHLAPENSNIAGYLYLVVAVGVGSGAILAGLLSGRNIEFGIVPIGAFGLSASLMMLYFAADSVAWAVFFIIILGISAGLFMLPLSAFIQWKTPVHKRGAVLAASNFLNFVGILSAALMIKLFQEGLGFSPGQAFLLLGVMTFILAVAAMIVLPDFFIRFIMLIITKIFYRIKIKGIENLPSAGGALLAADVASWVDPFILTATGQRRIKFLIEPGLYNFPWLYCLFQLMGMISISQKDNPEQVKNALRRARENVKNEGLVCVFAEKEVALTGKIKGVKLCERIIAGSGMPLVPVYIDSTSTGSLLRKKASVHFGQQMPDSASGEDIRKQIIKLMPKIKCNHVNTARKKQNKRPGK